MAEAEGEEVQAQAPYQKGAHFSSEISRINKSDNINVNYYLRGQHLVYDLIVKKEAVFACTVCVPSTMYRKLEVFGGDINNVKDGVLEAHQAIKIPDKFVATPPYFRSHVIANDEIKLSKISEKDGLHFTYHNKEILFPKGTILATSNWMVLGSGIQSLLVIRPNDQLSPKTIRVSCTTTNGYRFIVDVHPKLNRQLKASSEDQKAHRNSILTHALSRGLEILANKWGPDSQSDGDQWQNYENLRWLKTELENIGSTDWTDPDFHPEEAATSLRGHEISFEDNDED